MKRFEPHPTRHTKRLMRSSDNDVLSTARQAAAEAAQQQQLRTAKTFTIDCQPRAKAEVATAANCAQQQQWLPTELSSLHSLSLPLSLALSQSVCVCVGANERARWRCVCVQAGEYEN